MPSRKAWVQRPSSLIKGGGSTSTFKRDFLDLGRECFMEANINNQS